MELFAPYIPTILSSPNIAISYDNNHSWKTEETQTGSIRNVFKINPRNQELTKSR